MPKRNKKKVKKSVLTLPNQPAPLPQAFTVSDMNDSEYLKQNEDVRKLKPKRRRYIQNKKNSRNVNRQTALYKRDANYCSQLDIDVDGSSTDGKSMKKTCNMDILNVHDVWSVLRNVNKFQSSPMSQDSLLTEKKKKKINKKNKNRRDTRFFETCRTEEFAYISSVVDNNSSRNSYSESSFDRITVIEKQDNLRKIFDKIENEVDIFASPCNESNNRNNESLMKSKKIKINRNCKKMLSRDKMNENIPAPKYTYGYVNQVNSDGNRICQNYKNKNTRCSTSNKIQKNKCNIDESPALNKQCDDFPTNYNSSEYSDSSKGGIRKNRSTISDINVADKILDNKTQQVTGITKVVLNQSPNNTLTKQVELLTRKSNSQAVKPSKLIIPKLTLTDIKRKLANLRFPIVVLGKDQLSSTVTVVDYEPPQFGGLDEHIWPFMQKWYDHYNVHLSGSKNSALHYKNKDSDYFKTKPYIRYIKTKENNTNLIAIDKYELIENQNKSKKPLEVMRPMQRIKERMAQFMHKKKDRNQLTTSKKYDAATNTYSLSDIAQQNSLPNKKKIQGKKNMLYHKNLYPKHKSWGSEFIENIFRKIKAGVYYSQEEKQELTNRSSGTKEDFVQTESEQSKNEDSMINDVKMEEKGFENDDSIISIPGFDKSLPDLEIKTLNNCNQIAVKHCITNIVIHFDVAVRFDTNSILQIKKSFSCIPIASTENQHAIYKYKTSILNAVLPAELCSILPKLMEKIINPNMVRTNVIVNSHESQLSTINEITHNKYIIPAQINYETKTKILQGGTFSQIDFQHKIKHYFGLKSKQLMNVTDRLLLPKLSTIFMQLGRIDKKCSLCNNIKNVCQLMGVNEEVKSTPKTTCGALQPYQFKAKQVILASENFSFIRIVRIILRNIFLKIFFEIPTEKNNKETMYNNRHSCNIITLNFDTIYNCTKINCSPNTINECSLMSMAIEEKSDKPKRRNEFSVRNKRRGFVKLYRKCKSLSNISGSRSGTSLDKINNLDDFFLALGTGRTLSGVLDGSSEMKILSSIKEMKNWMNDITPRQALLVLLLANKKDTSNLIRYRPIILQGIAVNRITQATELDMEIEVIEKESLSKLPQYEGITYIPPSEENQDSLLEEICWIAKTTASDYQKPYDESSERLLKSLLEKRKKLNPSYLRVMARYVGLGLLKKSK